MVAATKASGPVSRKRQRSSSSSNALVQPASSALPDQHGNAVFHAASSTQSQGRLAIDQQEQYCLPATSAPVHEQACEGFTGMAGASNPATGQTSSAAPAGIANAVQTIAMAAEFSTADCNHSKQQLQRPVLASWPSNQLSSAHAAGTAPASRLPTYDFLKNQCVYCKQWVPLPTWLVCVHRNCMIKRPACKLSIHVNCVWKAERCLSDTFFAAYCCTRRF